MGARVDRGRAVRNGNGGQGLAPAAATTGSHAPKIAPPSRRRQIARAAILRRIAQENEAALERFRNPKPASDCLAGETGVEAEP